MVNSFIQKSYRDNGSKGHIYRDHGSKWHVYRDNGSKGHVYRDNGSKGHIYLGCEKLHYSFLDLIDLKMTQRLSGTLIKSHPLSSSVALIYIWIF